MPLKFKRIWPWFVAVAIWNEDNEVASILPLEEKMFFGKIKTTVSEYIKSTISRYMAILKDKCLNGVFLMPKLSFS